MIILRDIAKRISSIEQFVEQRQADEQQNSNPQPMNESLSMRKFQPKNVPSNVIPEEVKNRSCVQKESSFTNQNMMINNSYVENSAYNMQPQVSNYREKVNSINRILSDEIMKLAEENKGRAQHAIENEPVSRNNHERQIQYVSQSDHISQNEHISPSEYSSEIDNARQV